MIIYKMKCENQNSGKRDETIHDLHLFSGFGNSSRKKSEECFIKLMSRLFAQRLLVFFSEYT